jgi:hypothetical protein
MLKIVSSEVSEDSDINYMPVGKFIACLGVCAYLILNQKTYFYKRLEQLKILCFTFNLS